MERMLVRDKNSGAQTTPDFSKQVSDNKTKNTPLLAKDILIHSSFVFHPLLCVFIFVFHFS